PEEPKLQGVSGFEQPALRLVGSVPPYPTRARSPGGDTPDARNPEGASAEAFTLSGFPLLPELQDPEGPGLPEGDLQLLLSC
ncbi:MAG: hypothetical protein OEM84_13995, partial [Acidimicrobiia bacterium]|nr:hypothetical protein [Acidimicrobiia bacterium]